MDNRDRYPIGQQDFKMLREDDAIYIDKTAFIEKIVSSSSQYYFLARPRRFGKSLFLSTLRYFFEGYRELFKGLYIDTAGWEWRRYPVFYIDLNSGEYTDPVKMDIVIDRMLVKWEAKYGVEMHYNDISTRFYDVIAAAHAKTGLPVVILVDEYDKPLVRNLNMEDFDVYRTKLAALYSNFKSCAEHIRFVFITGVSRFSKLSVFSDLNNLNDITFDNRFADICGITEDELFSNLKRGIERLAENNRISYDEACAKLKRNYDGYRFAEHGSDIYNPWSVLNCLSKMSITNYWNLTGMPSIIAETLQRVDADLQHSLNVRCTKNRLIGFDLSNVDPTALLYQTGYLTIKDYDGEDEVFTLGIPNREVKQGLFDVLLPYYVKVKRDAAESLVLLLIDCVKGGQPQRMMECLQAYFSGIPYSLEMDNENNFHNAFYILTSLLGLKVEAEAQTSDGRIDMLMKTNKYIYIIELKYNGTAQAALDQINEKQYALPYLYDSRKVIKIGVNFSSATRRIDDWIIEEER